MKRGVMKGILMAAAAGLCVVLGGCGSSSTQSTKELTIINYSEYIDPDVLDMFTEETGIKVNYEEAVTPEELYTKYKSGAIEYDLVCTSDYILEKLISEGELLELDFDAMEYKDNIGDKYWEFSEFFDPDNTYTIPYFWGTLGILYNTTMVNEPVTS